MNNTTHPLSVKIPAAISILVITLMVVGAIVFTQHDTPAVASQSSTMAMTSSMPGMSSDTYKDGTYTATGSYSSPAGTEMVGVSLTLAGGMVTDSTVTRQANDPTASSYQGLFVSGYKTQVVGKKLSDIKLTNVSGSSLTPKGFMDALSKIETDAKA